MKPGRPRVSLRVPATFAHAAFAWPLRRLRLPWLALVVGSVTPDLAHRLPRSAWTDHTVASLFAFSLPLGLVLHHLARWALPVLASVAPAPWRSGLVAAASGPRPGPIRVAAAILAAAALHLAIDEAIRDTGPVASWLPLLAAPVGDATVGLALRYGLSGAGLVFLLVQAQRFERRARSEPIRPRHLAPVVGAGGMCLAVGLWAGWTNSHWLPAPTRGHVFLVEGMTAVSLWLPAAGLVVAAVVEVARGLARKTRWVEPEAR